MKRCPVIFLLVFVSSACAQYTDSTPYYAGLSSTGTFNKTNTSSSGLLNNGLTFSARKKAVKYNFHTKWLFGRQDGELTNNDLSSALDMNIYKTFPHFYYWGLLNYVSSYSLRIRQQLQAGGGVAYNVIDRKTTLLNISDGFIYDYSDIILKDSSREQYGTVRNSLRVQVKKEIRERFIFSWTAFYQPSLQYKEDYIVRSEASCGVRLKKWLSIQSACHYNTISRTGKTNLFITYGLTLENYF